MSELSVEDEYVLDSFPKNTNYKSIFECESC